MGSRIEKIPLDILTPVNMWAGVQSNPDWSQADVWRDSSRPMVKFSDVRVIFGGTTGLKLETASEYRTEDVATRIRNSLKGNQDVRACYLVKHEDLNSWTVLAITSLKRCPKELYESVALALFDVRRQFTDIMVDFLLYTREEANLSQISKDCYTVFERDG